MNEKMITIEPMNEGTARAFLSEFNNRAFTECNPVMETIADQLKSQLVLSDREPFLKVMRGDHLPKKGEAYFPVDRKTGEILNPYLNVVAGFDFKVDSQHAYAPTEELAEKLSKVITGDYRPNQIDINDETPFFRWDKIKKQIPNFDRIETSFGSPKDGDPISVKTEDHFLYFFTASQRDSFARQQEEKMDDGDRFFIGMDGLIGFSNVDEEDDLESNAMTKLAVRELNRIRTELARLSQLLPKE